MRADTGSLYDAHGDRLYAYCWSLLGDRHAAAAVRDTFTAAVHHPPRGDRVLWLYSLARTVCAERGAFTGVGAAAGTGRAASLFSAADPLLHAAGGMRADHREVLLLWAGEWLEPHDIALVVGIAPDTVAQLLHAARTRLERAVLDLLMRTPAGSRHDLFPLITAFEKGRLPQLLARRAPSRAPDGLRDRVLAACAEEVTRPLASVVTPSPLVIGAAKARSGRGRYRRRGASGGVSKGLGAAAGVAASAAAVFGMLATWPSAKGGGGAASLVPTASGGQTNSVSLKAGGPEFPLPEFTGSERVDGGARASSNGGPATTTPGVPPWRDRSEPGSQAPAPVPVSAGPSTVGTSPEGTSPEGGKTTKPAKPTKPVTTRPNTPSTPPDDGSPTAPPVDPGPTTPPDDGSSGPTTPPTDPPTDTPNEPSPSPTTNPTPTPDSESGQG
ncbi:DNA-directed RNA polymerase specialized sigma24 family protein [Actinomadura pelletieri DSM 43383]|uniref:DNA-directed RNA polymerase specialized sigma24 family protein n=1 Tax=Actinomadura pelletieri DSM 43383 TaxID=1120940 RepID=A0A495QHZ6_9ACTN|nr:hypothetical protein [Actinomadura pelletieri]RKS71666.1 DNA-directed RNA polymerase specialized sigma24 family protein [Actinomadura pelletieri DSM 43383]